MPTTPTIDDPVHESPPGAAPDAGPDPTRPVDRAARSDASLGALVGHRVLDGARRAYLQLSSTTPPPGVRETGDDEDDEDEERDVLLVRLDGVVHALWSDDPWAGSPVVRAAQLGSSTWPFEVGGEVAELAAAQPVDPQLCHLTWRRGEDRVLVAVGERTGGPVFEAGVEWQEREFIPRYVLPIASTSSVRPGERAEVSAGPVDRPAHPRWLALVDGAGWLVHDVRVAGRSQLAPRPAQVQVRGAPDSGCPGDRALSGELFDARAACPTFVAMDRVEVGDQVSVVVSYAGPDPAGAVLQGAFFVDGVLPERRRVLRVVLRAPAYVADAADTGAWRSLSPDAGARDDR